MTRALRQKQLDEVDLVEPVVLVEVVEERVVVQRGRSQVPPGHLAQPRFGLRFALRITADTHTHIPHTIHTLHTSTHTSYT